MASLDQNGKSLPGVAQVAIQEALMQQSKFDGGFQASQNLRHSAIPTKANSS
jgi:hypothetical protein